MCDGIRRRVSFRIICAVQTLSYLGGGATVARAHRPPPTPTARSNAQWLNAQWPNARRPMRTWDDGGPTILRTSSNSLEVAPSLMYVPMWHRSGKVHTAHKYDGAVFVPPSLLSFTRIGLQRAQARVHGTSVVVPMFRLVSPSCASMLPSVRIIKQSLLPPTC